MYTRQQLINLMFEELEAVEPEATVFSLTCFGSTLTLQTPNTSLIGSADGIVVARKLDTAIK